MQYDIINISDADFEKLPAVQKKMVRTAQQKKDDIARKADKDVEMFKAIAYTSGMKNSTLISCKQAEIFAEAEYQIALLTDNLIFNMSLNEPTPDDGQGGDKDESAGYIVDYSLSYSERYVIVRDYYLAISDPVERMNLYRNDETARKYLSSYYSTLYNVLATYSR